MYALRIESIHTCIRAAMAASTVSSSGGLVQHVQTGTRRAQCPLLSSLSSPRRALGSAGHCRRRTAASAVASGQPNLQSAAATSPCVHARTRNRKHAVTSRSHPQPEPSMCSPATVPAAHGSVTAAAECYASWRSTPSQQGPLIAIACAYAHAHRVCVFPWRTVTLISLAVLLTPPSAHPCTSAPQLH